MFTLETLCERDAAVHRQEYHSRRPLCTGCLARTNARRYKRVGTSDEPEAATSRLESCQRDRLRSPSSFRARYPRDYGRTVVPLSYY